MRRQFGKTIVELARQDPTLILLYGDVKQNMDDFEREFPDRIFNCGICEQSMTSMAAGMALEGLRPVVYSLTPFLLERAFEQWKMDVDAMNVPVIGVGYSFYPTHGKSQSPVSNGHIFNVWQTARVFENTEIRWPKNSNDTDETLRYVHASKKPAIICLTRDTEK